MRLVIDYYGKEYDGIYINNGLARSVAKALRLMFDNVDVRAIEVYNDEGKFLCRLNAYATNKVIWILRYSPHYREWRETFVPHKGKPSCD